MNWGVIIAIVLFVAAIAAWAAAIWAQRRTEKETSALRQEIQNLLSTQAQGLTAQLGQLSHAVTQQLGQVSQQVQSGMASTGTLVSDAQRAVSVQLQSATTIMGSLQQQLGKVEQSGRDLLDAAKAIETVLGGAKTRGLLGEVVLERMLADTLPASAYEMQHRFSNGEIVDAAVHVNGKLVPIDSKFSPHGGRGRRGPQGFFHGSAQSCRRNRQKIHRARRKHARFRADVCSFRRRLLRAPDVL